MRLNFCSPAQARKISTSSVAGVQRGHAQLPIPQLWIYRNKHFTRMHNFYKCIGKVCMPRYMGPSLKHHQSSELPGVSMSWLLPRENAGNFSKAGKTDQCRDKEKWMYSCGLVSNPELKPVLESALARNQPNHIQRRIKGRGGIEDATEAYLATTAFGRFSVVHIFCVGLDTGGMQRGLFQNKPALLVCGLFAAYAWLIDDDKI
jgi:hypothetical protein